MAIVDMSKFNLFAFKSDREKLLDALQNFEWVHFSEIESEEDLQKVHSPIATEKNATELSKVQWMINLLEPLEEAPTGLKAMKEGKPTYTFEQIGEIGSKLEFDNLYKQLREITQEVEVIRSEVHSKESEIVQLTPWKDLSVSIEDVNEGNSEVYISFGSIQSTKESELRQAMDELKYSSFEKVSSQDSNSYIMAIIHRSEYSEAMEVFRTNGFNPISLKGQLKPSEELERLDREISELKARKADLQGQLALEVSHLADLRIYYEYLKSEEIKLAASHKFGKISNLEILQGYIPTNRSDDFVKIIEDNLDYNYLELEAADRDSKDVPILLKNGKLVSVFENITSMYALPQYNEIDPTPFLAIFYWFFFGMMVADLGYGLLVTIATFVGLRMFNLDKATKKNLKFFFYLGLSTCLWGLVFGSFFGYDLPYTPLIDSGNTNLLLIISVILGVIHLFAGLAVAAYMSIRDGDLAGAFFDVGLWYIVVISGGVLLLSMTGTLSKGVGDVAKWILIAGMIGIVLFAARENKNPALRLAVGVYELYGISSWVGDLVSYSRLMALSLSGGYIALALNMIIDMMMGSAGGVIGAVVVFVFGHLFNAFLSYLSAYVHNARLTYVEFFGKFYEGGGKPFTSLRPEPKHLNIE